MRWLMSTLIMGIASIHPMAAAADSLAGPPANKLCLWYRQPAADWMTSALPIGNGLLGAMIFGGAKEEHIQFNDKTLWTGSRTSCSGRSRNGTSA
ncbi:MAG TPA: glycoside hydrolase N-terminal domain-containing protein, partial [Anaerohalosphaeraceae bacterium]|nr:glycoside hydrolase N-terminal domain-containing protein [Anaerohalosphaeraceae bacterium]